MKTRIKICGIKDPEMAKAAAQYGADWIGLIFHPGSKRVVSIRQAQQIAAAAIEYGAIPVAVLVDQNVAEIHAICDATGIDIVQLQGDKSRQAEPQLRPALKRIYAVAVTKEGHVQHDKAVANLKVERDLVLYDNATAGSGETFSWEHFKPGDDLPFLFSGGLNAKNVIKAIKRFKPYGVDVSSGVESEPGIKSLILIKAFIDACRIN